MRAVIELSQFDKMKKEEQTINVCSSFAVYMGVGLSYNVFDQSNVMPLT